jgi:hypothetical protein
MIETVYSFRPLSHNFSSLPVILSINTLDHVTFSPMLTAFTDLRVQIREGLKQQVCHEISVHPDYVFSRPNQAFRINRQPFYYFEFAD